MSVQPQSAPIDDQRTRWPRCAAGRGRISRSLVIALGVLMLLQPFSMTLYTYSFVTMLRAPLMFIVVSKFPE